MAENLKIIPLGGLNEIGKNMTVYEYGGEIIVVDCGMAFPGDDMYGIDLVIPDVSYLTKHKNRIRGLFITHGHEDHIGAIPYVLKQVNMPIYCTRLTAGLIRLKLEEHGLLKSTKIMPLSTVTILVDFKSPCSSSFRRMQARGQAGAVDGHIDLLEDVGDGPDMVLVAVGDEQTADAVLVLGEVAHVGNDKVDAVHIVAGKGHAAVHDDDLAAVLIHGHVLADLVQPAERDDLQIFCQNAFTPYGSSKIG